MPDTDVTELLSDPDFVEPLNVSQAAETVGTNGRVTITLTPVSPVPYAVIQPEKGQHFVRTPDMQYLPRSIKIWTTYPLTGPAPGRQPDRIVWAGDTFVPTMVRNWMHFGQGYVYAEADSIDATDQTPQ